MRAIVLGASVLLAAAACHNQSGRPTATMHPADRILATTALEGRPYPIAVTPAGRVLVGRLDDGVLASSILPDTGFAANFRVGTIPTDIALDPAGKIAFVANQFDDEVQALDAETGESQGSYHVTGHPFSVAVANDGGSIFVTTNADSVFRISRSTKQVLARRATDRSAAQSLVVDRHANRLYVSTRAAGTILELDANDLSLVRRFSIGGLTQGGGLVASRKELWVANEAGFVTIVSLAGGQTQQLDVGGAAWGLAVSPDQRQVWVGLLDSGLVEAIDVASREVVARIRTGGVPRRIAFTPRGDRAVIANEAGWVNVVR